MLEEIDIDMAVGNRIRSLRHMADLTQNELAERVGVRFQQIQKYERGTNRVSASKLWLIAGVLEVPVSDLFADVPEERAERTQPVPPHAGKLLNAYLRLPEHKQRAVLGLVKEAAQQHPEVDGESPPSGSVPTLGVGGRARSPRRSAARGRA